MPLSIMGENNAIERFGFIINSQTQIGTQYNSHAILFQILIPQTLSYPVLPHFQLLTLLNKHRKK